MDQTSAASPTSTQTTPTTTIGDASAALALADSSFATPAPETPAASDAPAAIQQAQPTDPAQVSVSTETPPETKGEPPMWRWQDILANAREEAEKKAETRTRQELEQQYAGLQDFSSLDAAERAGLLVWRQALTGDPQAIARIRSQPHLTKAMQALLQERPIETPDPEPQPDFVIPVKDAQGNLVGEKPIYSAETQAKREAWLKRQWMADVRKELQPLQQTAQTFQAEKAQATFVNTVASIKDRMKAADPLFETHMADVAGVLQADHKLLLMATGDGTRDPDPETALELAWGRVYRTKVLPAQQSQTESQMLAKLQQQAVAATTNPATASATTPIATLGNAEAAIAHARAQLGG